MKTGKGLLEDWSRTGIGQVEDWWRDGGGLVEDWWRNGGGLIEYTVPCKVLGRGFFSRASFIPYISSQRMTSLDLCLQLREAIKKLDGVGPVDNRPSTD